VARGFLEGKWPELPAVTSLFYGGGTPSLLPDALLENLMRHIRTLFPLNEQTEITLEANPETVTREKVRHWRQIGINRISMGVQTLDAAGLKKLERIATPESVERAISFLKAENFPNFSVDFIFGIPGQTEEKMKYDLTRALDWGTSHISFYSLTLKPGHVLYNELPSDDQSADRYEQGREFLEAHEFHQYEISNFAKAGRESRHNLLYWDGGDFLGVGPSAASRFFWNGVFHHHKQVADLNKYFESSRFPSSDIEVTTRAQTILEAAFLELRKNIGVSVERFESRYGYRLTQAKKFSLFKDKGLIELAGDRLTLTSRGRLLADSVTRELVD
jgi:putative oxygen-independent coproporphyrinogen III oxidase